METPGERSLVEELLSYLPVENWGVVDDVRYPSTIHLFQELCERVVTIYIVAPFDIRYPRLQTRDGIFSIEEQRKAEQASTEIQIEDIRSFANFLITNTSSTEDYKEI
jgi:dephospho-CoA kinase